MIALKKHILTSTGAFAKQDFAGKKIRNLFSNYQIVKNSKRPLKKRTHFPFQIFVYHRVLPKANPFAIGAIPAVEFQQQVELFHRYFRVVSLEQAVLEKSQGTVAPNTICLTFDDGYKDNYEVAFPILDKYHIPATIFLTTDFIGQKRMLWHDQVLAVMEKTKIERLTYEEANIIERDIRHPEARAQVSYQLLSWLKNFPPIDRDSRILEISKKCGNTLIPAKRMMLNWDEVKLMHRSGIDFGGHTRTHPILSLLKDEELANEIDGCKNAIEDHLQASVNSFAYPNGEKDDFGPSAKRILRNAGFQCAVSTIYGLNNLSQDDFELLRCSSWEHNTNQFYGRLLFERFFQPEN